jgi:hypothetical protein
MRDRIILNAGNGKFIGGLLFMASYQMKCCLSINSANFKKHRQVLFIMINTHVYKRANHSEPVFLLLSPVRIIYYYASVNFFTASILDFMV